MSELYDLSIEGFVKLDPKEIQIVDIRDAMSFSYGHIPEACNIPEEKLEEESTQLSRDRKIVVYCKKGLSSESAAQKLRDLGFDACQLTGGYMAWLMNDFKKAPEEEGKEDTFHLDVERSIQKKYHKEIWSKFTKAISKYQLLQEGDHVAVCISGGKDSMLMAKLFQQLHKYSKIPFEVTYLVMDPGYNSENREMIEKNAEKLHIPITVFETNIFEAVYEIEKSPCYLCARMRRGYLYSKAQELGCNKIALGHHYDDVIETILMGMLYGAQIQSMMPKLHSTNFQGMELIRPLYLIREDSIKAWRDYNGLHFIQCACRFTDTCTTCNNGENSSKRLETKQLIRQMKEINPYVETNIFNSVENVNLDTLIEYKQHGVRHNFLDDYHRETRD